MPGAGEGGATARAAPEGTSRSPYTVDFSCAGPRGEGLGAAQVTCLFGDAAHRIPHPATDGRISEVWDQRLEANPRLFDGAKFRLHKARVAPARAQALGGASEDEGAGAEGGGVELVMGLTGYREYVGTNLRPPAELRALIEAGVKDHGDRWAHLSNALGEEAVMLTADGKMVLLRRSGHVATGTGLYNGPSGHPEPDAAGFGAGGFPDPTHSPEDVGRAVVREVFASVARECVEETGMPPESLGEPRMVGGMRDATGKPDLLFLIKCSLTGDEVAAHYKSGGAEDAWESDRLLLADPLRPQEWRAGAALTSVTEAALECLAWGGEGF